MLLIAVRQLLVERRSLNGKMLAEVEEAGKPSKWLTCFGHHVLLHFGTGR